VDVQRIEETSHLAGHKPAGRQQRVNVERLAGMISEGVTIDQLGPAPDLA
jgi:hypothetical protein